MVLDTKKGHLWKGFSLAGTKKVVSLQCDFEVISRTRAVAWHIALTNKGKG